MTVGTSVLWKMFMQLAKKLLERVAKQPFISSNFCWSVLTLKLQFFMNQISFLRRIKWQFNFWIILDTSNHSGWARLGSSYKLAPLLASPSSVTKGSFQSTVQWESKPMFPLGNSPTAALLARTTVRPPSLLTTVHCAPPPASFPSKICTKYRKVFNCQGRLGWFGQYVMKIFAFLY